MGERQKPSWRFTCLFWCLFLGGLGVTAFLFFYKARVEGR